MMKMIINYMCHLIPHFTLHRVDFQTVVRHLQPLRKACHHHHQVSLCSNLQLEAFQLLSMSVVTTPTESR